MCHLLQNSAISLEKYGLAKFCFKSKPKTTVSGGEVDENGIVVVNETTLESDK